MTQQPNYIRTLWALSDLFEFEVKCWSNTPVQFDAILLLFHLMRFHFISAFFPFFPMKLCFSFGGNLFRWYRQNSCHLNAENSTLNKYLMAFKHGFFYVLYLFFFSFVRSCHQFAIIFREQPNVIWFSSKHPTTLWLDCKAFNKKIPRFVAFLYVNNFFFHALDLYCTWMALFSFFVGLAPERTLKVRAGEGGRLVMTAYGAAGTMANTRGH